MGVNWFKFAICLANLFSAFIQSHGSNNLELYHWQYANQKGLISEVMLLRQEQHLTWSSSNWSPPKAATQGLIPPVPRAMSNKPTTDRALGAKHRADEMLTPNLKLGFVTSYNFLCVQLTCGRSCCQACRPCPGLWCHWSHPPPWWPVPPHKRWTGKQWFCAEGGREGSSRRGTCGHQLQEIR